MNFGAATDAIPLEVVGQQVPHGPDPAPYVEAIRSYLDAGFEHIAIIPVGDEVEATLDFWEREVQPELRRELNPV